jgi:hypothetical protein
MVRATKNNSSLCELPNQTAIRNQAAEIRNRWSVGERHHRARLALRLQERLLFALPGNAAAAKAS